MPRLIKSVYAGGKRHAPPNNQDAWKWMLALVTGLLGVGYLIISGIGIMVMHHPLHLRPCPRSISCSSSEPTSSAAPAPAAPLDAISYICTGKGCNLKLLCTSATALRRAAGWEGPLYVITDQGDAATAACNAQLTPVPVPQVTHQMHMKNMKRNLLSILPGSPAAALYIDADVVPVGCLQTFLEEMARAPGGAPDLAFFHDNFCLGCNTFNGGFVYQRDTPAARQCLADWDEESSSNNFTKYVKDQDALDQVLRNKMCTNIRALPWSATTFVDSALWPAWIRMSITTPYFLHFTTGVRLGSSWDTMQSAMDSQISALQHQQSRC
mmetsp:Transcript_12572/g.24068  ORF Transcript_12572/g.24068 Transcript_12572/m.24068 type:complete len:325 (+) Transcript_12572:169-1143(+)